MSQRPVEVLRVIKAAQRLGFSLNDVAELLEAGRYRINIVRDGGLVVSQPEGTRRIYRLNPQGVGALSDCRAR